MTQTDSFFAGGAGRSVSWKNADIGTTVTGIITSVGEPQPVTDPIDGSVKTYKKGPKAGQPVMQVRIDLDTELRRFELCKQPDDPNEVDDGTRSLYVGGWMAGAIADAMHKAGVPKGAPKVGAKLSVTLSERTPPDNPALNPTNKFEASYVAPNSSDQFFNNDPQTPAAPANGSALVRPEKISESAWNMMDDATKRAVATTMTTVGSDAPPF